MNIFFYIIGTALMLCAIPAYKSYQVSHAKWDIADLMGWSYGGYYAEPKPTAVILLVFAGVVCIVIGVILSKKKPEETRQSKVLICPKCGDKTIVQT